MSKKSLSHLLTSAILSSFLLFQSEASCQPVNDNPCEALDILCNEMLLGSTDNATQSNIDFVSCSGGSMNDVFYKFQANAGEEYTVMVNGDNYDGVLIIYSGTCDGELEELICADQGTSDGEEETVSFSVNSPTTIFIRTYDYFSSNGSFELSLNCMFLGNTPCDAIALPCNETIAGSTLNASPSSTPSPTCSSSGIQNDVYYSFYTLPHLQYTISAIGVNIDAVLTFYTGSCDGELTEYACVNNESSHNTPENYNITTSEQTQFLLRITDNSLNEGDFELTFNCNLINDDPCNAKVINCGESILGSNVGALPSGIAAPTCANGSLEDVFYQFEAVPNVSYHIQIQGDNYGAVIAAYSGTCNGELTQIDCADDGQSAGIAEELFISVNIPQTIIIRTYDFSTSQGSFEISLDCTENYDCPELGGNFLSNCDDQNPNTINDSINFDCVCAGQYENGSLSGAATWNSNCGDRDLTVQFYDQHANEVVASYNTTLTSIGNFSIDEVLSGTFDIYVKIDNHLQKAYFDIEVESGANYLDIGVATPGDLNNNNTINISDLSILIENFGKNINSPNFNPSADLDCNGFVNIIELSILINNFGMGGANP